jgi:hypothetical protein
VASNEQPVLEAKTAASAVFRKARPARLLAFEDTIEVRTAASPVKTLDAQRVRYDQVAQVSDTLGLIFADLGVETRGGDTLLVPGLTRQEAKHVGAFIRGACCPSQQEQPANPPFSTSRTSS